MAAPTLSRTPGSALVVANAVLVAVLVVHALDHALRQEATVPGLVVAAGAFGFVAALVALGLGLARARLDAPATAVVGFGTVLGFLAVHVAPDWGPFSQPYSDIPVDDLSWAILIAPIAVAAAAGLVGLSRSRPRPRA
ncbi:MAG: hypothetical protein ACR2GL_05005 [Thermoleophilaceae bacterium]